jgi:hypothetical protein
MVVAHQERLARNEAFFREVNERIHRVADGFTEGSDEGEHSYEFLCECSRTSCSERIELTLDEYEHVRAEGTRFVLLPGHELNAIEEVVAREDEHVLVEKDGLAGEVAAGLDPRAA